MSRFHIRRRLGRLRRAPWRDLFGVTISDGFVFVRSLEDGSGFVFDALSWTGFYEHRGARRIIDAWQGLETNRRVIRELRRRRGRRC